MFEFIPWTVSALAGAMYLLTPAVVRSSFRCASRCQLRAIAFEEVPEAIAAEFRRRVSEFNHLGFALIGCFDCGSLTNETHSYVAYFCNHTTNEFGNVSAMMTPNGPASYFEFSSRFPDGCSIETNTNEILPLMPANASVRVFRFASLEQPRALLKFHRQLTEKYALGLCPLGEPRDAEIQRYIRMVEQFGPRLGQAGYLKLDEASGAFRPTWKGAFRMAWLGLWPVTFVRKAIHRHAMQLELQSLQARAGAALQKA